MRYEIRLFAQAIRRALHLGGYILRTPLPATALALIGWCMLPALFPGGGVVHGQISNATIRGQLLDPNGALVPGAQVLIVNHRRT